MKNICNKYCKNALLLSLLVTITNCNNPTNVFYGKSILHHKTVDKTTKVVARRKPVENSRSYYSEDFKKEFNPSSYSSANYENIYDKYFSDTDTAPKDVKETSKIEPNVNSKPNLKNLIKDDSHSLVSAPIKSNSSDIINELNKSSNVNKPVAAPIAPVLQDIGEATPNINSLDNVENSPTIVKAPTAPTKAPTLPASEEHKIEIINNNNTQAPAVTISPSLLPAKVEEIQKAADINSKDVVQKEIPENKLNDKIITPMPLPPLPGKKNQQTLNNYNKILLSTGPNIYLSMNKKISLNNIFFTSD